MKPSKPYKHWITTYKPQGAPTELYLHANDEHAADLHYGHMMFSASRGGDRIGRTRAPVNTGAAIDELLSRGEPVVVYSWSDAWERYLVIAEFAVNVVAA